MIENNPHGILVGVHNEGIIYGWVAPLENSSSPQKIYLVADQSLLGSTETAYLETSETTQLGFAFIPAYSLVAQLTPGSQIRAYFDPEHTQELANSPLILDEASLTSLVHRAYLNHPPQSYMEDIRSDGLVYGWAFDPHAPDTRLPIYLYIENIPLRHIQADIFREDLRQLGMGDGRHGFGFPLDSRPDLLNKLYAGMSIHAYFDEARCYELEHSPVQLSWEILEPLWLANRPASSSLTCATFANISNIAPEGIASQSSFSEWSMPNDAQGAVTGIKTGKFGFCTSAEYRPWWQLDLGYSRKIVALALYNREDAYAERAKHLTLEYSEDGDTYHTLCNTHFTFGGIISNRPLFLNFDKPLSLRFFRITLNGRAHLHLDQVELFVASQEYGLAADDDYHQNVDHLNESLALFLKEQRFDEALRAVYLGFEAERNADIYQQWYGKMVEVATQIHAAGVYHPKTLLLRSRWGGICNRLYSLATAYSYSALFGLELGICWTSSSECPSALEDFLDTGDLPLVNVPDALARVRREGNTIAWVGAFKMEQEIYDLLSPTPDQRRQITELTAGFIRKLAFSAVIQARAEEFIYRHYWDDDIIGVHVRGTDHTAHYTHSNDTDKLSPLMAFKPLIEERIAQGYTRFYLATDELETLQLFQSWFGDRIFTRPKRYNSSQLRQTSTEDAIIDLILLSKTQAIIGSKLSSFSEFAATLGNIPLILA